MTPANETPFYRLLTKHGLSHLAQAFEALRLPAVDIIAHHEDNIIGSRRSHFGGYPSLPIEMDWPCWRDVPMLYIGQIDLSDIPPEMAGGLLPDSGLLTFFYASQYPLGNSLEEAHTCQVFFTSADIQTLERKCLPPIPAELAFADFEPGWVSALLNDCDWRHFMMPYAEMEFSPIITIPSSYNSFLIDDDLLTDEEIDRYILLGEQSRPDRLSEDDLRALCMYDHDGIQLVGYPQEVQWEMQPLCAELFTMELTKPFDWQLLLQWPDNAISYSMIYFWILKKDLAQRRFDRVLTIRQN